MTCDIVWRRLGAGHYTLGDFTIRRWTPNAWYVFRAGEPWGRWKRGAGFRSYRPFRCLWEARAAVEEHAAA